MARSAGLVQKKGAAKEDSDDDAEDDFERQVVSFIQVAPLLAHRCITCADFSGAVCWLR